MLWSNLSKSTWAIFWVSLWLTGGLLYSAEKDQIGPWHLAPLLVSPATEPAPDWPSAGVEAIFFTGLPWHGQPTKVFAYIGIPPHPAGEKVPGMVLVHGGGGTAFAEWVRLWNSRGYAAIAMDTCGCLPGGEHGHRPRHAAGGPPGWGGLDQLDEAPEDQWAFHAVADVLLAHSLLRSHAEVDSAHIGLTGISWGGYLTALVAGIDDRFCFAAPVYGCGYLSESPVWRAPLASLGPVKAEKWRTLWDPATYLPRATIPMLWVSGTNDHFFPMDLLQRSLRASPRKHSLSLHIRMPHSQGAGATPVEIHAAADFYCRGGSPLAQLTLPVMDGTVVHGYYTAPAPVTKVELLYTTDDNSPWEKREWLSAPAEVKAEAHEIQGAVPAEAKLLFFNLTDARGLVASSEYLSVPAQGLKTSATSQ